MLGIAVLIWVTLAVLVPEARWSRFRYDAGRWSTVFPLGMNAGSFAVGAIVDTEAITSSARRWVRVALAAWAIVFPATLGRAIEVVRKERGRAPDRPAPSGDERPPRPSQFGLGSRCRRARG